MRPIYEYLNRSSSKIKINKKRPDRFWIEGESGGVNISGQASGQSFLAKSINDNDWKLVDTIDVREGECVNICTDGYRANLLKYSGSFNIGGNILGLTRKEYDPNDDIMDCEFQEAFANSDVIDCRDLIITSDKVGDYSMSHMFDSCRKIIYSPVLPSTKLGRSCYSGMFEESNVKHACPELPATILSDSCYLDMYYNCWELTDTPRSLPAITLANRCYYCMFGYCEKLKHINFNDLPAKKMKGECYLWMFHGCYDLIDTPKICAEVLADKCFEGMFNDCNHIKDITFTSSKMRWDPLKQKDSFEGWNNSKELANRVTLTISKNVNIDVPDHWIIKEI